MGLLLQYVEMLLLLFHNLFICALIKGERLLIPSEKKSYQPVSCLTC